MQKATFSQLHRLAALALCACVLVSPARAQRRCSACQDHRGLFAGRDAGCRDARTCGATPRSARPGGHGGQQARCRRPDRDRCAARCARGRKRGDAVSGLLQDHVPVRLQEAQLRGRAGHLSRVHCCRVSNGDRGAGFLACEDLPRICTVGPCTSRQGQLRARRSGWADTHPRIADRQGHWNAAGGHSVPGRWPQ